MKEKQSNLARFKDLGKGEFRPHLGSSRSPGCGEVAYWSATENRRGKKPRKVFYCTGCGRTITTKSHLGEKLDILRAPRERHLDS